MAFTVEHSIEIGAAPEAVYRYLATSDDWRRPTMESVAALTDGPMRVGSRYETRGRAGGLPFRVVNEITSLDPPRLIAWKEISGASPVTCLEGCYQLDPAGAGTRFTLRNTYTPRPGLKLATPLLRWVISRQLARMMPRARDQAEAAAG